MKNKHFYSDTKYVKRNNIKISARILVCEISKILMYVMYVMYCIEFFLHNVFLHNVFSVLMFLSSDLHQSVIPNGFTEERVHASGIR